MVMEKFEKVSNPVTQKAPEKKTPKSEEASSVTVARANRRQTRRHTAHVPGPRQQPKLGVVVPAAEEETEGVASAEPEAFDEGGDNIAFDSVDR